MNAKKICLVTIFTVLSVSLISCIGCSTAAKIVLHQNKTVKKILAPTVPDHTLNGTAWVENIGNATNSIAVLHLACSNNYSQGYYHGKLFAKQIRESYDAGYSIANRLIDKEIIKQIEKGKHQVLARLVKLAATDRVKTDVIKDALDKAWSLMEPYVPQSDKDEMQGLADGMRDAGVKDISVDEIHRLMAVPDLTETSCSATIAIRSATSDGHVWQQRILDYGAPGLEKHPLVTIYHPTKADENTVASIGWMGFVGTVTGMNDKKVAISELGLGRNPGETLRAEPMIFLLKRMLRYADNASSGAGILRSARRNNWYAYAIGDTGSNAIGMITSPVKCDLFPVNTYKVISFKNATHDEKLPQYKDIVYAGHKNAEQSALCKKMYGRFDLETMQELARNIRMDSNLHTVIFDLTTGDMWIANRTTMRAASDCDYVHLPFSAWNKNKTDLVQ